VAHAQIAIFARTAKENAKPARVLAGQKTLLARTMHDIRYDAIHDEILVTNPFAKAILTFRGDANGEEAPVRVIQGPHTQLGSSPDRLDVDPVHNEIFIPGGDNVLVYPRDGNGDVPPLRQLKGPDTQLHAGGALAVDPVNNLLVVGLSPYRNNKGGFLIFDRTASGNAKPKAVIMGPKTEIYRINQLQVYSPRGWIVATQPGIMNEQEPEGVFVGVWSIHDNGDVPPRWKIAGEKTQMKKPRGVVLDPKHKEVIVADMRLNSVLTYYFPELF
jgi:hypothetical protein